MTHILLAAILAVLVYALIWRPWRAYRRHLRDLRRYHEMLYPPPVLEPAPPPEPAWTPPPAPRAPRQPWNRHRVTLNLFTVGCAFVPLTFVLLLKVAGLME